MNGKNQVDTYDVHNTSFCIEIWR